jgi:hypothetical protein
MTVYVDPPLEHDTAFTRRYGWRWWCHMASDRPGEEGTRELLALGKRIGLQKGWLQDAGQRTEHFDLKTDPEGGRVRAKAIEAGAVPISHMDFARQVTLAKVHLASGAAKGEATP